MLRDLTRHAIRLPFDGQEVESYASIPEWHVIMTDDLS